MENRRVVYIFYLGYWVYKCACVKPPGCWNIRLFCHLSSTRPCRQGDLQHPCYKLKDWMFCHPDAKSFNLAETPYISQDAHMIDKLFFLNYRDHTFSRWSLIEGWKEILWMHPQTWKHITKINWSLATFLSTRLSFNNSLGLRCLGILLFLDLGLKFLLLGFQVVQKRPHSKTKTTISCIYNHCVKSLRPYGRFKAFKLLNWFIQIISCQVAAIVWTGWGLQRTLDEKGESNWRCRETRKQLLQCLFLTAGFVLSCRMGLGK